MAEDGGGQATLDAKPAAAKTAYEILTSDDDGATWREVGGQLASGREAALRAFFAAGLPDGAEGMLFRAVSAAAWGKPLKLNPRVAVSVSGT